MSTNRATFSEGGGRRAEERRGPFLPSSVLCPPSSGFRVHPSRRACRRKLRRANGGRARRRETPKNFSRNQRRNGPRSRRLATGANNRLPSQEKVSSRAITQSGRSR